MSRTTFWSALVFVGALAAGVARADVVGTTTAYGGDTAPSGAIDATGDCKTSPCSVTFANQSQTVFGIPINLGTISGNTGNAYEAGQGTSFAGVCAVSQLPCSSSNPCSADVCVIQSGTFTFLTQAQGCGCDTACNCSGSCDLCYNTVGSFVCSPSGCASGAVSYVGNVTAISGSALATLPAGLVYTNDGTVTFTNFEDPPTNQVPHYAGAAALNVFQPQNTPEGTDVTVTTDGSFTDSRSGKTVSFQVDVTFANVTGGHCTDDATKVCTLATQDSDCTSHVCSEGTVVTALSNDPGTTAPHFAVDAGQCSGKTPTACRQDSDCGARQTCKRYDAFFFDVSSAATTPGSIQTCLHYDDAQKDNVKGDLVTGTAINELSLALLHKDPVTGQFVDVTQRPAYPDPVNNIVCGVTTSLSPFVLAVSTNIPGGGAAKTDCISEWNAGSNVLFDAKGLPKNRVVCKDGDPCDGDGVVNGSCEFTVDICPNDTDARLPGCTPSNVAGYTLLNPGRAPRNPIDQANRTAILNGLAALGPGVQSRNSVMYSPALTAATCASGIHIAVPRPANRAGRRRLGLKAQTTGNLKDTDSLTLICTP